MTVAELLNRLRELDVRVWCDGDDLRIGARSGTLTEELREELASNKEDLLRLLKKSSQTGALSRPPLVPQPRPDVVPLSFAQQRLWFLQQLDPQSPAYNTLDAMEIEGRLDIDALPPKSGRDRPSPRVDPRSSAFPNSHPVPGRRAALDPPLEIVDARGFNETSRAAEVDRITDLQMRKPFDLAQGPLLRSVCSSCAMMSTSCCWRPPHHDRRLVAWRLQSGVASTLRRLQ